MALAFANLGATTVVAPLRTLIFTWLLNPDPTKRTLGGPDSVGPKALGSRAFVAEVSVGRLQRKESLPSMSLPESPQDPSPAKATREAPPGDEEAGRAQAALLGRPELIWGGRLPPL